MKDKPSKAMGKLIGQWRIVETDHWDRHDIDLVGPAFISFSRSLHGEFAFITVHGWMDCGAIEREGRPGVEFTWEGSDEGDQVHGRAWPYDRFMRREHWNSTCGQDRPDPDVGYASR